ncbi:MAG: HD domain-containing protein [Vicinamibacteria bacterium]|nr:HD domain-containing protein [Vicinamibacteria bacterium]
MVTQKDMPALVLPRGLLALIDSVAAEGGQALLVGGAVRDALLGLPLKDYDIEIYGIPEERLPALLDRHGKVDAVGQAFTVLKLSGLDGLDGALDVSLPRRDSKVGPGHRGIAVNGDPELPVEEAARRRDFTINAMLYDPAERRILDPFHGRRDLKDRVLRAVDPATFTEDPLRALRAVQFAARFDLRVEPRTAELCAVMPLHELPAERVFTEMEKLILRAARPSVGLRLLSNWGLLSVVAPELIPLAETPQDPFWHPEGDVFTHTLLCMDQAAGLHADLDRPRALSLMLATLCHDLGKPSTTACEGGRIRSLNHEEAGVSPTESLLDRWNVHTLSGYDVRSQILGLVANHLKPMQFFNDRERITDGAFRRLARKCELELLGRVARADCLGRVGRFDAAAMDWFLDKARRLDVSRHPPEPLLRGRDVLEMGIPSGPAVGRLLRAVYERQLDGDVASVEDARAEARRILASPSSGKER